MFFFSQAGFELLSWFEVYTQSEICTFDSAVCKFHKYNVEEYGSIQKGNGICSCSTHGNTLPV